MAAVDFIGEEENSRKDVLLPDVGRIVLQEVGFFLGLNVNSTGIIYITQDTV